MLSAYYTLGLVQQQTARWKAAVQMFVTCGLLPLCYVVMSDWCMGGCYGDRRCGVITGDLALVEMRISI